MAGLTHRVLIVEDELPTAAELQIAIGRIADTRIASTERDVFFQLKDFDPDAILLDITLEGETQYPPTTAGLRILERIRLLRPPSGDVPVIVVTARVEDSIEAECRRLNVAGFYRKPVSNQRLQEAVAQVIASEPRQHVFISYCRRERRWVDELLKHLRPLRRRGMVPTWLDSENIPPGSDWETELARGLRNAKVAVLLVTKNYLASDFITEKELPYLLGASERGDLTVLWIAAGYAHYGEIGKLQALNDPKNPLEAFDEASLNRAMVRITEKILEVTR